MTVSCTLTVGANTETRTATIDTDGTAGDPSTASIPLQATGPPGTASVSCQSSATGSAEPAAGQRDRRYQRDRGRRLTNSDLVSPGGETPSGPRG